MTTTIDSNASNETRVRNFSTFRESKRVKWSNYRNYGY